MNPLAKAGMWARRGFGRVVPDPFVVAVALTLMVMVAALAMGHSPAQILNDWSGTRGVWALLGFTMQMCLMLVLGAALASAPPVARAVELVAGVARTPRQLVGLTALLAIGLSLLNWSLALVGGALLARSGGQLARRRGWRLHYPLLCAAGYSGLMTWHGGLSGTAPLKATTLAGMQEVLGPELGAEIGAIGLERTVFSDLNFVVSGGLLVLGPLLFMLLCPAGDSDREATSAPDQTLADSPADSLADSLADSPVPPADTHEASGQPLVERIERSRVVTLALAVPLVAALGLVFADRGLRGLSFNTVNLALWCVALLLHGRPDHFVRACERGLRSCTGVVLQFPLYAGIMGMMAGAGLSAALAQRFAQAGPDSFALLTFASAGLLNLFVPSGGGQWAVQGPIVMQGAATLGLKPGQVLMAMAYGDQWTNMLQPFWALPLLAITGVKAREIIGYCAIWMLVGGVFIVGALVLV